MNVHVYIYIYKCNPNYECLSWKELLRTAAQIRQNNAYYKTQHIQKSMYTCSHNISKRDITIGRNVQLENRFEMGNCSSQLFCFSEVLMAD